MPLRIKTSSRAVFHVGVFLGIRIDGERIEVEFPCNAHQIREFLLKLLFFVFPVISDFGTLEKYNCVSRTGEAYQICGQQEEVFREVEETY
jgi:hypothetical protein